MYMYVFVYMYTYSETHNAHNAVHVPVLDWSFSYSSLSTTSCFHAARSKFLSLPSTSSPLLQSSSMA